MMQVHGITNIPLKEDSINNNVIRQIANSDTFFYCTITKKSMKKYADAASNDNKAAISLWKNLLIDAICLLKMNDSREKLYDAFKEIYNTNKDEFITNFDNIRLRSSYGIDELEEYFSDFVDFESVLYGTGKYYRDHVLHLIQVWAIGIGIFCNHEDELDLSDEYEYSKMDFDFLIDENSIKKFVSKSEIWAMWTIMALCHDLGYPIEKASNVNKETRKIVKHFGCLNFQELNYSFEIFNGYIVDKFLNIVSSKAIRGKGTSAIKLDDTNKTAIQSKYHDKFSKSLEDFNHGMFSGLLIFKKLTYFLETDYYYENSKLEDEDIRQFYIRKEILRAICGHTCSKVYHLRLSTLSFLLILCDEIQEWNRPNFDDYRLRVIDREPEVQILEYDLKAQKFHIFFKYDINIDKADYNYKYLVENRFKTLHYLVRSAKGDKHRHFNFIWEIESLNYKYKLEFSSAKDAIEEIIFMFAEIDSTNSFKDYEEFDLYEKTDQ